MKHRWSVLIVIAAAAGVVVLSAQAVHRVKPQPIPVRFAEGTVHGFVDLHTATGTLLANGDLLQVAKEGGIESRMIFHFLDGSFFEETVLFTQQREFALRSYHLVQRGPAFADDLDASLQASGKYVVKTKSHGDGKLNQHDGTLNDMPPDVSNGLVITILKNLTRHDTQTVHLVAFTPQPQMIALKLTPVGERQVMIGQRTETAVEFDLKPELGAVKGFFAKLLGRLPPDSHVWIVIHEVPAFVRFEGPLYTGPVWRIDLGSPRWSRN